ncbi:hypothetical protein C8R46DRAFT_311959 [Mycena filopes]|nr:hypothetical protein C8R46DRAFT_311959 [Mycena filopes]
MSSTSRRSARIHMASPPIFSLALATPNSSLTSSSKGRRGGASKFGVRLVHLVPAAAGPAATTTRHPCASPEYDILLYYWPSSPSPRVQIALRLASTTQIQASAVQAAVCSTYVHTIRTRSSRECAQLPFIQRPSPTLRRTSTHSLPSSSSSTSSSLNRHVIVIGYAPIRRRLGRGPRALALHPRIHHHLPLPRPHHRHRPHRALVDALGPTFPSGSRWRPTPWALDSRASSSASALRGALAAPRRCAPALQRARVPPRVGILVHPSCAGRSTHTPPCMSTAASRNSSRSSPSVPVAAHAPISCRTRGGDKAACTAPPSRCTDCYCTVAAAAISIYEPVRRGAVRGAGRRDGNLNGF